MSNDLAAQAEEAAKNLRPHRGAEDGGKGPCPYWCPKEYGDSDRHDDYREWASLFESLAAELRLKDAEVDAMREALEACAVLASNAGAERDFYKRKWEREGRVEEKRS